MSSSYIITYQMLNSSQKGGNRRYFVGYNSSRNGNNSVFLQAFYNEMENQSLGEIGKLFMLISLAPSPGD